MIVISAFFSGSAFIIQPKNLYYALPEAIVEIANEYGLAPVLIKQHEELDKNGQVVVSQSRFDYIFRKIRSTDQV